VRLSTAKRAASALFVVVLAACSAEARPPNIVLILADDMGYADVGCYGSDLYRTPKIDKLATEGIRFTDAYAACPVCSPTRAALLTGQYPARLHITDWLTGHKRVYEKLALPDWRKSGLADEDVTIPEVLKQRGYVSCAFGKWHLGRAKATGQGFDEGASDVWELNKKTDQDDPKGVFTLTKQTLDFIHANKDKPFFAYLPHYSVHTPVRYNDKVKAKYEELVTPHSRQTNAGYAAMVEALDDSVGMLLDGLDEMGLSRDTMVIFYSDNGGLMGQTNNSPLRGGKGMLYEGGTRVPLIVRWPGRVKPGTTNRSIVTSTDFLPTFCELAGAESCMTVLDGVSLVGALTKGEELISRAIYWHYPHYHKGPPGSSVRSGKYKLIQFLEDMNCELYDLSTDLGETKDLAADLPDVKDRLLADLDAWRKAVGAQMMDKNPDYDPKFVGKTPKKKQK